MEDVDDVRNNSGTVADFSNWRGIKASGNLKPMKFSSKEKVIDDTEDDVVPLEKKEEAERIFQPKKNFNEIPAANEAILNPTELKSIAVRLLPSVDKIENNEKAAEYCEKAIDTAFTFLKVWDLKVNIGG